ncbi:monooxygenase FAD-binding protein [Actinobacteria bacterium OV320]|nr:monooxygenase FAD-binding protein [Actinobacteria bacterium OV320]
MHDVVIAGAGPVGLLLACELGLAGCDVLVLEKEPETGTPWKALPLGMRGLSAASVEVFLRRGMLQPLLSASGAHSYGSGDTEAQVAPAPRSVSHFAGMMLNPADIDSDALPYRLPSPVLEGVMTSLEAVETVLAGRAAEVGVEIRRGRQVTGLRQDAEGVLVQAGEDEYAARWLVGCDGGRSTVRGLAGFEFTGTQPLFTGYTMLATVADPDKLKPGFTLTPTGMYLQMPTPGHIGMLDCDGGTFDRSQQPPLEHLQTVLRRVSGTDVTLRDVQFVSTFTDRAMQTTSYRQGRVLLAGDAAHIHSPLGAQGLNTGIGDAINLGWKLAATVHGYAHDGLLDSYTQERHPIGAHILDWTRAQSAVMKPDPHAQAIQALVRDLLGTRDGTTYVYSRTSGASHRYDFGSTHPLVGRNAPEFRFTDGTWLSDFMQDGRGIALDLTTDQRLAGATAGREDLIRHVSKPAMNELGCGALLVRPDGVIAWADGLDPDHAGFELAAARWFGTAVV